jgi:hypothetical protein
MSTTSEACCWHLLETPSHESPEVEDSAYNEYGDSLGTRRQNYKIRAFEDSLEKEIELISD